MVRDDYMLEFRVRALDCTRIVNWEFLSLEPEVYDGIIMLYRSIECGDPEISASVFTKIAIDI